MPEVLGVVEVLRRYPVKSMQGECLHSATLGDRGLVGDREFAVVDVDTGQVVRGKTRKLGPLLLACRAAFEETPEDGAAKPSVVIELPDGTRVRGDSVDVDDILSEYLGRPVRLVSSAPANSAFMAGRRAFLTQTGLPGLANNSSLVDAAPVSVLTTSTLARLAAVRPETLFDERRFRMNVVVTTHAPEFLEEGLIGRRLRVGATARVHVAMPTPRCVLATMAQEDLPRDPAVLQTVARQNSLKVGGKSYPCAGVYATVDVGGAVHSGDLVWLAPGEEAGR